MNPATWPFCLRGNSSCNLRPTLFHVCKLALSLVSTTSPFSLSFSPSLCNPIRPFLKVSLELFLLIGALTEEEGAQREAAAAAGSNKPANPKDHCLSFISRSQFTQPKGKSGTETGNIFPATQLSTFKPVRYLQRVQSIPQARSNR